MVAAGTGLMDATSQWADPLGVLRVQENTPHTKPGYQIDDPWADPG
jgi:hypothetical protein